MVADASFLRDADSHKLVASGALAAGELGQLADGRACVVEGLQAVASGDTYSARVVGIETIPAASGTTFSKGDPVYWDESASLAIAGSLTALNPSADFYLGVAHKAKVSGQTVVEVDLNAQPVQPAIPRPFVYEFDCQTGVDAEVHTLVPAWMNKTGLLVLGVYALVTEVFAGTEDQGIVTIKDTHGTPNTICTLTATDAGADAVNDVIVGTSDLFSATTGDAAKVVAAGLGITGAVTQATTGAAAGKMKVYVLVMPLL